MNKPSHSNILERNYNFLKSINFTISSDSIHFFLIIRGILKKWVIEFLRIFNSNFHIEILENEIKS